MTFVESNSEQPSPEQSFNRQQTYKIGAKLSLLDRLKGIFNPNALLEQIVGTIETVDQGMTDEEVGLMRTFGTLTDKLDV